MLGTVALGPTGQGSGLNELIPRRAEKSRQLRASASALSWPRPGHASSLILSAFLDPTRGRSSKPAAGSLLADLWSTVGGEFLESLNDSLSDSPTPNSEPTTTVMPDQSIRRAPSGWQPHPSRTHRLDAAPAAARSAMSRSSSTGPAFQARRSRHGHSPSARTGRFASVIENLDESERNRLLRRIPALLRAMGSGVNSVNEATPEICQGIRKYPRQ